MSEPDAAPSGERSLFATEPRAATSGVLLWFVAAASLVIGIVIGFFSGYTVSERQGPGGVASAPPSSASVGAGQPAAARTFSEGDVAEPVRVDPEPIQPAAVTPPPLMPPPVADTPVAAAPVRATAPERRMPPAEPRPAAAGMRPAAAAPRPALVEPRAASDEARVPPSEPRAASGAPHAGSAAPVASGPGSLHIVSRPAGAQVILDGRAIGVTPLILSGVPSGSHDVRLELPGFRRWATSVEVSPGNRTRVAASLEQ